MFTVEENSLSQGVFRCNVIEERHPLSRGYFAATLKKAPSLQGVFRCNVVEERHLSREGILLQH